MWEKLSGPARIEPQKSISTNSYSVLALGRVPDLVETPLATEPNQLLHHRNPVRPDKQHWCDMGKMQQYVGAWEYTAGL